LSGLRAAGRRSPALPGLLLALVLALVLAGAAALEAADRADERALIVGTAPVSGIYYPAGGALCRAVNAERRLHGLRCLVESTEGSAENLRRLIDGDIDFALLQSDWQYHAYMGTGGPGVDRPIRELRAVLSLHAQPLTVVVARESGIDTLEDLKGKRVNLGIPESAVRLAGETLIENLGWSGQDFAEVTELSMEQQVDALCAGLIDAFIIPTSHPNGVVAAATEGCLGKLIDVAGPAVERLLAEWPFYAVAEIPGGLYRGNPEPVRSFGVRATLVTLESLPPEVVYQIVKSVFDDLEDLRRQHPALSHLTSTEMIGAGNTAPLHDGAAVFFREHGLR